MSHNRKGPKKTTENMLESGSQSLLEEKPKKKQRTQQILEPTFKEDENTYDSQYDQGMYDSDHDELSFSSQPEEKYQPQSVEVENITHKKNTHTIIAAQDVVYLKELTHAAIEKTENFLQSANFHNKDDINIDQFIDKHKQYIIGVKLAFSLSNPAMAEAWKNLPFSELFTLLKQAFPANINTSARDSNLRKVDLLKNKIKKINLHNDKNINDLVGDLLEIANHMDISDATPQEHKSIIDCFARNMGDRSKLKDANPPNPVSVYLREKIMHNKHISPPLTLHALTESLLTEYYKAAEEARAVSDMLGVEPGTLMKIVNDYRGAFKPTHDTSPIPSKNNNNNNNGNNNNNKNYNNKNNYNKNNDKSWRTQQRTEGDSIRDNKISPCKGCGRLHPGTCTLEKHPDFNRENVPWCDSTNGKAWAEKQSKVLPWVSTLSGQKWAHPPKPGEGDTPRKEPSKNVADNNKRKYINNEINNEYIYNITNKIKNLIHTIPMHIQASDRNAPGPARTFEVQALLDTGAVSGDYINHETAQLLINDGAVIDNSQHTVCNAFGTCNKVIGNIKTLITLNKICDCKSQSCIKNNLKNNIKLLLNCTKIESPYDVIIGRNTMQK